jgi:hypothetical protein
MITRLAAISITALVAEEDLVSVEIPACQQVPLVLAALARAEAAVMAGHTALLLITVTLLPERQTQDTAVVAVDPPMSPVQPTLLEKEPMVVAESLSSGMQRRKCYSIS